jgi:hypothetical protein
MTGPIELNPEHSPLAKLAGTVLAVFWNGITGVFA